MSYYPQKNIERQTSQPFALIILCNCHYSIKVLHEIVINLSKYLGSQSDVLLCPICLIV